MSSENQENILHSEFVHMLPEHETELRNRLYQLWRDSQCCDLTISLKGGELQAHSCVLAAFSPKVKTIMETLNTESKGSLHENLLHLTFEVRVFECLLNVMYTGILSFNTAMLPSVLSTARWLQMDHVVRLCQEYKEVIGNSCSEFRTAEESVLTEVNSEEKSVLEIDHNIFSDEDSVLAEVNTESIQEDTSIFHPAVEHDKLPRTDSQVQKKGRRRGRPLGSQRKCRKYNSSTRSSPVRVKLESNTEPEPDVIFSHPVDVIHKVTNKGDVPKQTSQKPKLKKGEPAKPKQRPTKEQKTKEASPEITEVKTESVSPEESLDSSFSDPNIVSHMQWVEAQSVDSQGKDEAAFAMGKTDHIRCKKCLAKFKDLDKYFSHITNHPVFKCECCDLPYYRLSNLTRHMRTFHSAEHHLGCKKCDFLAGTETVLRKHFKEVHGGDKPFICEHAGCTYSSRKFDFLRRHSKIHSEVKHYMCTKCGQGFAQYAGLMSHERTCYHLQQFLCDLCGQAFNHVQSMRAHRRTIHFGEKPYVCRVCGNLFSDQRNMKRHMRIHENSFPYQCPVCQQKYRHSNSLKAHLKKHEKDGVDISILFKESVQNKTGIKQSDTATVMETSSQSSGNSGDLAVGSQCEQIFQAGSGKSAHSLSGTEFPGQSMSQTSATTAETLSGFGSCSESEDGVAVKREKNMNRNCNVLTQLNFDGKTSDSVAAACICDLDPSDVTNPVLPQTSELSEQAAERFLVTSSLEPNIGRLVDPMILTSEDGPAVIKVELLNAGRDADGFGQVGKIEVKDQDSQKAGEDSEPKGQSSYGLQTLANICFSSTV